jgi:hypothetical protein
MNLFDWQTEESAEQPFLSADPSPPSPKKHGRKLLLLLSLLAALLAAFYWQLDRRATAQETLFKTDIMAAFKLWQQAITQSDEEIFNALLVGAEPAWATGQRSLFTAGQLLGRSDLGLIPSSNEAGLETSGIDIHLSPDWTAAEISFQLVYKILDGPAEALSSPSQIRLAQTVTFRRSADRWFLAPPPADYWGCNTI